MLAIDVIPLPSVIVSRAGQLAKAYDSRVLTSFALAFPLFMIKFPCQGATWASPTEIPRKPTSSIIFPEGLPKLRLFLKTEGAFLQLEKEELLEAAPEERQSIKIEADTFKF